MPSYFIGIDGGGSKTRLICIDRDGNTVAEAKVAGTYYRQDGVDAVIERLRQGMDELYHAAGIKGIAAEEVIVGFGMPGYGENKKSDDAAVKAIQRAVHPLRII
ncbi:MAG: hypothetical protein GXW96_00490, partial [Christensenellaceae bacterium]|nr:hypothetical protein [Christensenellaceae bacterium]